MKKILNALAVFIAIAITLPAMAQPAGMGKNDPDAKKILDAVSAKFKSYKAVQSKFTLKIENNQNKVIGNKAGTVYMKGTKYRVTANGQEIYCDGATVWTLDNAAKEVTVSKLDLSNNTITPQKLFTNFYDKDFLYKLNSDKGGIQEIELTPIDKNKAFFKVILYISSATKSITSAKVFEKAGNRITYSVSALNGNATVADAMFVYDAKQHPGVDVVDLR